MLNRNLQGCMYERTLAKDALLDFKKRMKIRALNIKPPNESRTKEGLTIRVFDLIDKASSFSSIN